MGCNILFQQYPEAGELRVAITQEEETTSFKLKTAAPLESVIEKEAIDIARVAQDHEKTFPDV